MERRLQSEFRKLNKQITSEDGQKAEPFLESLELVGGDLRTWRVKVSRFAEEGTKGGKALNQDLARLGAAAPQHGAHLQLEINFPSGGKDGEGYPTQPFTIRVVTPRCIMYTGHVTAGGTVCIQALVATGQPGGWQPDFSVGSILLLALQNMVDTDQVHLVTAANPMGALTGPLRVDFNRGIQYTLMPYSNAEAQAAHQRQVAHHARHGWGAGPAAPVGGMGLPPQQAFALPPPAFAVAAPVAVPAPAPLRRPMLPSVPIAVAGAAMAVGPSAARPVTVDLTQGPRSRQALAPPAIATTSTSPRSPPGAPARPAAAAPATRAVVDLTLSDDDDDNGGPVAARRPRQQPAPAQPSLFPSSGRAAPQPGGILAPLAIAVPLPAGQVAAATAGGTGLQAAGRKRVPCLSLIDDDSDDDVVVVRTKQQRRDAGAADAGAAAALAAELAREKAERARLMAQLAALQGQQEQLRQLPPARPVDPRLSAPVPSHWAAYAPDEPPDELKLVVLPLPADQECQELYPPRLSAMDQIREERQQSTERLQAEGIPWEDAVAALRHCVWREDEALAYARRERRKGGAARVLRLLEEAGHNPFADEDLTLRAAVERADEEGADEEVDTAVLAGEVETVLRRFEASQGQSRNLVRRIERVQNWCLWTKYTLRRSELINSIPGCTDATSPALNEQLLWHGTDKKTVATILQNGFDMRVANLNGALGGGVYFAESSSYSLAYSRKAYAGAPPVAGVPIMAGMGVMLGGVAAAALGGLMGFGPSAAYLTTAQLRAFNQQVGGAAAAAAAAAGGGAGGGAGGVGVAGSSKRAAKKTKGGAAAPMVAAGGYVEGVGGATTSAHSGEGRRPHEWKAPLMMILSRVVLGKVAQGHGVGLRREPEGHHSAGAIAPNNSIFAVFDNAQAIPEYLVHFDDPTAPRGV